MNHQIHQFTPWETATGVKQDAIPGLFHRTATTPLTAFFTIALSAFLWHRLGPAAIPVALIFGRMMALDLTTYTLPNIYTLPLCAVGLVHAFRHDIAGQAILAIILLFTLTQALQRSRFSAGLGGGDLKLLAALFAFLPLPAACWAIAAGCLVYLPAAFLKPKSMVPFGLPLLLGWAILLRFPHISEKLFSLL